MYLCTFKNPKTSSSKYTFVSTVAKQTYASTVLSIYQIEQFDFQFLTESCAFFKANPHCTIIFKDKGKLQAITTPLVGYINLNNGISQSSFPHLPLLLQGRLLFLLLRASIFFLCPSQFQSLKIPFCKRNKGEIQFFIHFYGRELRLCFLPPSLPGGQH